MCKLRRDRPYLIAHEQLRVLLQAEVPPNLRDAAKATHALELGVALDPKVPCDGPEFAKVLESTELRVVSDVDVAVDGHQLGHRNHAEAAVGLDLQVVGDLGELGGDDARDLAVVVDLELAVDGNQRRQRDLRQLVVLAKVAVFLDLGELGQVERLHLVVLPDVCLPSDGPEGREEDHLCLAELQFQVAAHGREERDGKRLQLLALPDVDAAGDRAQAERSIDFISLLYRSSAPLSRRRAGQLWRDKLCVVKDLHGALDLRHGDGLKLEEVRVLLCPEIANDSVQRPEPFGGDEVVALMPGRPP